MSLIVEHLYLGPVTVSRDTSFFKAKKISHVLIAAKGLKQHFKDIKYKQLNLSDNPTANISKYFTEGLKFIHEAVSSKKNILVHCLGGISRSVSMVIVYIMFSKNLSFADAFEFVKALHSKAQPNPGFAAQLTRFEKVIAEYHVQNEGAGTDKIDFNLLEVLVHTYIPHGAASKEESGTKEKKNK